MKMEEACYPELHGSGLQRVKIIRNSCLSFCVSAGCQQKHEPLRPFLSSLVA